MTRGWFDAFRENGGPTLYSYSNRTAVTADVATLTLYLVFVTLFVAFVIIFPGVRRQRFTTFTSVTLSLFVGTAILVGQHGSAWHTAEVKIQSAYRAFSREKVMGTLGVNIGLNSVNVTLKALPIYNQSSDIDYNERFHWYGPTQIKEEYNQALLKGLPFPILTVGEYFTVDAEGFCWGRNYREAGYYTSIFLWMAFTLWVLANLMLVVVPRYGAYLVTLTGFTLLFCNFIYFKLLPSRPLHIRLEQSVLMFDFGWSYWLVMVAGVLCVLMGGAVSIIDLIYPHKFSTILEVDFGTPFDRHTIIEDSQETKKKKNHLPKLEEPPSAGLGSRLLRRLSKRDREGRSSNPDGHDNYAFEMEAPKSPWRYPHLMFRNDSKKNKAVSFRNHQGRNQLEVPGIGFGEFAKHLRRTDSKDSSCSSLSSVPVPGGQHDLRPTVSVPVFHDHFNKFKRTDSESSGSSFASIGLSILSRGGSRRTGRGADGITVDRAMERTDSSQSFTSQCRKDSGDQSKKGEEVCIVVSNRKDSITNAVRRNSGGENTRPENIW
jgi:dual oxidase maturation factor 1